MKKVLGGLLSFITTLSISSVPIYAATSTADQLYVKAYNATNFAVSYKTQKLINDARTAVEALKGTGASWAIGEFSKQLDQIQQPILVKIINSINNAKSNPNQANVNTAKAAIDPELIDIWRNSYSSAVDTIQQKLMNDALDAQEKATRSEKQTDVDEAINIIKDIQTASDPAIANWAAIVREQINSIPVLHPILEKVDNLDSQSDINQYQFTLSEPGKVALSFKHEFVDNGGWYISLYDSSNNRIHYFSLYNNNTNIDSYGLRLPVGTYLIKVQALFDNGFNNSHYTLKVNYAAENSSYEKEVNNSSAFANKINPNSLYVGNIHNYDDKDYYKFSLQSAGKVTINFKHDIVDNGIWNIELYDENNNNLQLFSSSGTKTNINGDSLRLPSGNYYLLITPPRYDLVYGSQYNDVDYSFTVKYTTENDSYEKENNDTLARATTISTNRKYIGNLQSTNDNDYYKFTLTTDSVISLNFQHDIADKGTWNIQLFDGNNKSLQYLTSAGAKADISGSNLNLSAGNYYIAITPPRYDLVYGIDYNNMDYSFSVNLK